MQQKTPTVTLLTSKIITYGGAGSQRWWGNRTRFLYLWMNWGFEDRALRQFRNNWLIETAICMLTWQNILVVDSCSRKVERLATSFCHIWLQTRSKEQEENGKVSLIRSSSIHDLTLRPYLFVSWAGDRDRQLAGIWGALCLSGDRESFSREWAGE